MITKLSLKNIFRNKRRTLITMSAITVGVSMLIFALGYIEYVKWGMAEGIIHSQTGHFQLCTKNILDKEEEKILEFGLEDWTTLARELQKSSYVDVVTPRIGFSALGSTGDKSTGILVSAIIPESEIKLGGRYINASSYKILEKDPEGILVGPGLAKLLKAEVGDSLTLMTTTSTGALNAMDFKVIGTRSTGVVEMDKRYAVISLASAQQLLATPRVENLLVGLKRTEDLKPASEDIGKRIPENLALRSWSEVDRYYKQVIGFFYQFVGFFMPVLMIIVWFSTMNTVLMSVLERSAELATLRAMGTSRGRLFRLLFFEGVWIGVLGICLGVLLDLGLSALVNHARIMLPAPPGYTEGYALMVRNVFGSHLFVALLTMGVIVLSTLIPAHRVNKINIVKALRGS